MTDIRDAWTTEVASWGGVARPRHLALRPGTRAEARAIVADPNRPPLLAHGCGRSYGDVALNPDGRLALTAGLDRFIAFDRETGLLTCEAGVRLADILDAVCRPEREGGGWFLPVSPGTRFVTVAGAIANDVHGKNHHAFGTFGRHVAAIELACSDGTVETITPESHPDLFAATIGGLGLTGLILSATIRMRRIPGTALEAEDIRFDDLDAFFALADDSDAWEYTAAWIDCLATGTATGRGIFSRARHAPGRAAAPPALRPRKAVPLTPPVSLVGGLSLKAFNALYWRKLGTRERVLKTGSYEPVFYPLDAIGAWNRLYGPKGFYQFQNVVPPGPDGRAAIAEMLRVIAQSGQGSMLAVLKTFGDLPSPGLLSFPKPGITLALDFPNKGPETLALLARLEAVTVEADGRIYPAKDSCMSAAGFARGYPAKAEFQRWIDPAFSSAFARRVGLIGTGSSR